MIPWSIEMKIKTCPRVAPYRANKPSSYNELLNLSLLQKNTFQFQGNQMLSFSKTTVIKFSIVDLFSKNFCDSPSS